MVLLRLVNSGSALEIVSTKRAVTTQIVPNEWAGRLQLGLYNDRPDNGGCFITPFRYLSRLEANTDRKARACRPSALLITAEGTPRRVANAGPSSDGKARR